MTSQLLSSELSTLVQDSKKKYPDLRNAAEKSLSDLKALPNTSEAQLAADLKRRPDFFKPFALACGTKNPKVAASGVTGLLRLVVFNGLPSDSLRDVLQAFQECATLSYDVQLRVLQALPSLWQNYAESLKGKLLVFAFQVCFTLHGSKTAVVSNTAAASLQQLLAFAFENIAAEDGLPSSNKTQVTLSTQEGPIAVHQAASDAYYLLNDICLLTEGSRPQTLHDARLTPEFGLELLESLLTVHIDTVAKHPEFVHMIRTRLMPFVVKVLSEKSNYNVTVRTFRLLRLLVPKLLPAMIAETQMAMSLLNHLLDPSSSVTWKKVLCLELWRDIHDDPTLIRNVYAHFDQVKENKSLLGDHLSSLVRLAAEKPAVIGLGQRSSGYEADHSIPAEQLAVEAGGLSGAISLPADEMNLNKQGLNAKWSSVRTSCIDQVDKTEPPVLPATYLYSLVLTIINRFSDGLAKFLLPFTLQPDEKPKRKQKSVLKQQNQDILSSADHHKDLTKESTTAQSSNASNSSGKKIPVNPLRLKDHEEFEQIRISALVVEHCWPALLATSSTFLNASLDSEYYHALIRSIQRFTQVAGVLDLETPRDAFLITLAKHAMPSATVGSIKTLGTGSFPNQQINDVPDGDETKHGEKRDRESHFDLDMNSRNLLCLRALLNLGTALGPVLHHSWAIVFHCLHQVDVALIASHQRSITQAAVDRSDDSDARDIDDLRAEKNAVEVAVARLFESTSNLSDEAFIQTFECLRSLVYRVSGIPMDHVSDQKFTDQVQLSANVTRPRHIRLASISSGPMSEVSSSKETIIILKRTTQLAQFNTARFCQPSSGDSGWTVLSQLFIDHLCSSALLAEVRISAARDLDGMINRITSSVRDIISPTDTIRQCLDALSSAVSYLWRSAETMGGLSCSLEIHSIALESLLSILEQCGDTLQFSWDLVFSIINSAFQSRDQPVADGGQSHFEKAASASRSSKLARSAFSSLHLICSDFLGALPNRCFSMLLDTLHCFSSQSEDFNTSLTSVALFRNVADFLQQGDEPESRLLVDEEVLRCTLEGDLVHLIDAQADDISTSVLWMCLVLHLAHLSTDSRVEVRNSALHTLFGIFDTCAGRLDAVAWAMCFRLVFAQLLSAMVHPKTQAGGDLRNWDDTSIVLVRSISITFNQSLATMSEHQSLASVWDEMLARFALLLKRHSLSLSRAIFSGLADNLAEIERTPGTKTVSLDPAWALWVDNIPTSDALQKSTDNNGALTAYVRYIRQLHQMLPRGLDANQAGALMEKLKMCIIESTPVAYGSDVDEMTEMQSLLLETITLVPLSTEDVLTQLVKIISSFVSLPFQADDNKTRKSKTYIALSKATMRLLENLANQQSFSDHASTSHLLGLMIRELEVPIRHKYKGQREGKGESTWKKATSTFLSILDAEMLGKCTGDGKDKQSMWEAIVSIGDAIMAAHTDSCDLSPAIHADQAFDIESFSQLQKVIIPSLGSPSIPDKIRRRYIASIFQHSLIHEPHPDDLARPDQELLDGLRSHHVGRVQDLPPTRRSKMAYVLVDHLFDLAAMHDGSVQRVRLAQVAAPYLILRVGLVLKAYVYDQPLRGLMPQPLSQKTEMHYVLEKLMELDSEPKAIPETSGVQSEYKKHLFLLFGLVTRAMKAARRDEEMRDKLMKVLDVMGTDFGF